MLKCLKCNSEEVIIRLSDYCGDDLRLGHDYAECPNCGTLDLSEVIVE